jgi:hypothetical protein
VSARAQPLADGAANRQHSALVEGILAGYSTNPVCPE